MAQGPSSFKRVLCHGWRSLDQGECLSPAW
jgi:hypothetical protein